MMKKIVKMVLALVFAASTAMAADSNSLFSAKELSVAVGSSYALEGGFKNSYNLNFSAGASYYLTKYLGVSATVPFYQSQGVSLREVSAGPQLRVPFLNRLAVYGGPNVTYNWQDNVVSYYANAGLETRLARGWGIFTEGQYNIGSKLSNIKDGNWLLAGGLRLVF